MCFCVVRQLNIKLFGKGKGKGKGKIMHKLILCISLVTVFLLCREVALQSETESTLSEVELWETFGTKFGKCVSEDIDSCAVQYESCSFGEGDCEDGYMEYNPPGAQMSECQDGVEEEWW